VTLKKTLRLSVDPSVLEDAVSVQSLHRGAAILRSGGTVAFPTETVYGLGANALDPAAVQAIFEAKQRPTWDPLIVHVAAHAQLSQITTNIPANGRLLMEAFWPGPLTLLLPKSEAVPDIVTAGRARVGVRMPSHPVARRLLELTGIPLAAPSANSFGRTSPTRAEFVLDDLDGRIDAVIDSGETALGLESTVVDACEDPPVLYRPGMITLPQLQAVCPSLVASSAPLLDAASPASQPSPGISLKHYAPKARLILLDDPLELPRMASQLSGAGETVGIMAPDGATFGDRMLVYRWGRLDDSQRLARRLFAGLRELDAAGATVILCPQPPGQGLGVAIRDRLLKAAR
jgi:L-threonylcarbamoyladenylate synthase